MQNLLAGMGVQISKVTFNELPGNTINPQIGSFNDTNSNIGINSSIILCTGDVIVAVGPNDSGDAMVGGGFIEANDPDLYILTNNTSNDKAEPVFSLMDLHL